MTVIFALKQLLIMRHISPRWVFIIVGFLLLAVSDFADSALLLIKGTMVPSYMKSQSKAIASGRPWNGVWLALTKMA